MKGKLQFSTAHWCDAVCDYYYEWTDCEPVGLWRIERVSETKTYLWLRVRYVKKSWFGLRTTTLVRWMREDILRVYPIPVTTTNACGGYYDGGGY